MAGLCSLKAAAQPVKEPPVPAKSQKRSKSPPEVELNGPVGAPLLGDALGRFFDQGQVAAGHLAGFGARQLVDQDHFGAQGGHHARAFHGVAAGHDGHKGVTPDSADDGQAGAGIAAGEFDHGLTGLKVTGHFGVLDHLAGDAVFLGEAGVEIFQFCKYPAVQVTGQAGEFNQGGVADGLDGRGEEGVRVHGTFTFRNRTRVDTEFKDLKKIFEGQTTVYQTAGRALEHIPVTWLLSSLGRWLLSLPPTSYAASSRIWVRCSEMEPNGY